MIKHKDPYQVARELYENTVKDLNERITSAMNKLFYYGDITHVHHECHTIYGIKMYGNMLIPVGITYVEDSMVIC